MINPNYVDGLELRIKELSARPTQQEVDALKAQVEVLHKAIYRQQRKEGWHEEHPLVTLCIATPTQYLAEVRAQAVEDAADSCCYETYAFEVLITTKHKLRDYANKLHQQAKGE